MIWKTTFLYLKIFQMMINTKKDSKWMNYLIILILDCRLKMIFLPFNTILMTSKKLFQI